MFFNLEDLNPFTRFYFDDDNQDMGWVDIRVLSKAKQEEINRKTIKIKKEYRDGNRFSFVDDNPKLRTMADKMTWEYCIGDWLIFTTDKEEIENTDEMKVELMNQSVNFATFITDCMKKINDERGSTPQEDEEKN